MNLDSNIEFDAKRFFRWWGRELAFLIPEKLRHWLSDQSGQVFLTVSDEQLRFSRLADGERRVLAMATVPLNEQAAIRFDKLKAGHPGLEKARCILRLNAQQAIGKMLYLPAAARENLEQVLTFEMDRYMPFKADQVYFAYKPMGKPDNGQIRVQLVVTPKRKLDALIAELHGVGIYPAVAEFVGMPNDFDQDLEPYNLLPEPLRPTKDPMARVLTWATAAAALLLSIAILVFPVWHEGREVDSLKRQIRALEEDARVVQAQQLEIDEIVNETERLLETKNDMPSLTHLLNTLSKLLPDDTWLTHLKYHDQGLQLQGQSPAASLLIGVLEASPLLQNARFVSPLTQDRRTGMERFQISVEVRALEEPADDE